MSSLGSTIGKVAALAGGAIVGAYLASMVDKLISSQAQERPDYEKSRYAQGLTAVTLEPQVQPQATVVEEQNMRDNTTEGY